MLLKQTEGPAPNNWWSTVNLVSLNYTQPLVEKKPYKKRPPVCLRYGADILTIKLTSLRIQFLKTNQQTNEQKNKNSM